MPKDHTLLDRAKLVKEVRRGRKQHITAEEIELALAWARDEVTLRQASVALNPDYPNTTKAIVRMAYALRETFK